MNTIFCGCDNAYQDEKYGFHRRVWTPVGKASKGQVITKARCTACGTVHDIQGAKEKPEKKTA